MPAPKGVNKDKWERCILKVKKSGKDVDPFAVCTAALESDKYLSDKSIEAAISSVNGALLRGKKKECREAVFSIKEIQADEKGRQFFPVTIIAEGLGNLRDKNYYTADAIKSGPQVYEGKQAYYDHPSTTEDQEQPNRTINKLLGHYEDIRAVQSKEGLWELQGKLFTIPGVSRADATEALEHAVNYKKKYPDKDFIGISINGDGEGESLDYDDFIKKFSPPPACMQKLKQIEGQSLNAITKLSDAFSADVVTAPGAGGKINTVEQQRRIKMKFIDGMKRFFSAMESGDVTTAEGAVKDMLQDEGDDKKEGDKKEVDSLSKKVLQMMQKEKKKEDESEDEYEARMMKQIKKELEAYMGDKKEDADGDDDDKKKDDKKEADDKKDDKDDDDKKEDDKEDDDKKDKEDEDEKKEADGDDSDDKDHPDAKKDKALINKMLKKHDELEAKLEKMGKELEAYQDEAKKSKEEAAKANTELRIKNRETMIDSMLFKSGYRREITSLWKPVLEACKTEKEMGEKLKLLKEAAAKVNAERFWEAGSIGTIEKQADSKNNDDIFLKGESK